MSSTSRLFAVALVVAALAPAAKAGGPLLIFDPATQTPYAWGPGVRVYTDLGTLGLVTNAQADVLVADAAASWTGVPTSSFSASVSGDFGSIGLPDITGANAGLVLGPFNGGGIHAIYDSNGSVIQNFFGAPPGVLGIASPEYASGSTITEGWMIINGAPINSGDLPLASTYAGVVTHEMGHAINMAHTQTNGAVIFFGDTRGPGGCGLPYTGGTLSLAQTETMFPFIDITPGSTGLYQATVSHKDDQTTLSDIYPAPGYPSSFATIEGVIYSTNGTTQLTGVNVIARNLNDAYADAVSALSGDFTQGDLGPDGRFRLTGLTPGAQYVLYVDQIVQGGFSTTPLQPLPASEEWWNSGENNFASLDPPCSFTPIVVNAGQTFVADVKFNGTSNPPLIQVDPTSLSFSLVPGASALDAIEISNVGQVPAPDLQWSITENPPVPWLTLLTTSGTTGLITPSTVTVIADATGLTPGLYQTDLDIASNDPVNPVVSVPVELQVTGAPEIQVIVTTNLNGPVSLLSRPDGTGRPLTQAQAWDGIPGSSPVLADATITVRLVDGASAPVVGFPAEGIRVVSQAGGWAECPSNRLTADAPTDANGLTTISGALFAGGHSATGELMQVVVDDPTVTTTTYPNGLAGLEIFVNSPDINRDLDVNLSDVGAFAAAFAGVYDYAADYIWNGQLNLSDVGQLAAALGATCPAVVPKQAEVATRAEVGLYFDAAGTRDAIDVQPGEAVIAYVIARGEAVVEGVEAADVSVRVSDNVVVHEREAVDAVIDLGEEFDTLVGYASPRASRDGLVLVRLRLGVTDDQPARVWLEGTKRSPHEGPTLSTGGVVVAARPVSGAVTMPVASMNAEAGDVAIAPRSLSMAVAPNPFNPKTEIRFALPNAGPVELRILNARGALVTVLQDGALDAGEHRVAWDGTDQSGQRVSSGTYYSQLVTRDGSVTEKLVLVK